MPPPMSAAVPHTRVQAAPEFIDPMAGLEEFQNENFDQQGMYSVWSREFPRQLTKAAHWPNKNSD